ncbi:MAG: hypothetical protein IJY11_00575 [Clostridia bacterium]|nr:hypothetical protein [Clostridia bacterium]
MVSIYSDADYEAALQQKKRIWLVFWIVTLVYLAFCIAWVVYYTTLPVYPKEDLVLPQAMVYGGTAVYILFTVPFVGIKLSRVRKYCKMMGFLSLGIKNVEENYFMGFYKQQMQKDNVDVISCVFRTWNKRRKDWTEREVYLDNEQEWPEMERGDYVRYVVQSNFIIQYKVLRVGAMQEDIEKGLIPQDMMREDRPVFGKIYNVSAPSAPQAQPKEVEEIASVAETAPATDEQAEATKTEEEQTQEEN